MPKDEKIQVNFATAKIPYYSPVPRWEHRIAVHPVARDEILLTWYRSQTDASSREQTERLTTSLFQHWVNEAKECQRDFRYLAAIHACRQALRLKPDRETEARLKELETLHHSIEADRPKLRHLIAEGNFDNALSLAKRILKWKPDDAKTVGQFGTLLAIQGQKDLARDNWRSVAQLDPDDPYGESMLGWQAYLDGQFDEALKAYLRAEEIEPYFDKIQYHMGLVLIKLNRPADAIDRFQRALSINPNHVESHLGMVAALRQEGLAERALPHAEKATTIDKDGPNAIESWRALAETYAELGRFADAEKTAMKLISLARNRKPEILPEIRKQVEEWHTKSRPTK